MRESWEPEAEDLFTAEALHDATGAVIAREDAGKIEINSAGETILTLHETHGVELTVCRICDHHWIAMAPIGSVEGAVECPNCGAWAGEIWDGYSVPPGTESDEDKPGIVALILDTGPDSIGVVTE